MKEISPVEPWKQEIFYHLLIWSIFIGYELICIFATVGLAANYLHYGIYYILYICLFYFNAHVILDLCFFRTQRPYLIATILIMVEIAMFVIVKSLIDKLLTGGDTTWWVAELTDRAYLLANVFRLIFFIGFSIAYWSMLYFTRFRDRTQKLEIEQLRQQAETLELENRFISVENAYLQNQVSPHLLFNSLNFIYYAVYQLSDRAGKGIMLLSNLLRYSLTAGATKQRMVGLQDELEQVRNLIELDRMRFKDKRYLSLSHSGKISEVLILPLAILTLVENMIKHGECGDPDHPATAELSIHDNKLRFTTVNKKRSTAYYPATGIGLVNLRKRLANTYPERSELSVTENTDTYTTLLQIDL